MARVRTQTAVFDAVLALAREKPSGRASMEGIAARAGVSKQTLYRTWPSTGAILFDALLSASAGEDGRVIVPDTGDLEADLVTFVTGAIAEMTEPSHEKLLRTVTADIQTDHALAAQFRERLLTPQLAAVSSRLLAGDVADPDAAAELLLGPILHRWLLRTGPFEAAWPASHVRRVLQGILGATTTSAPHTRSTND